MRFSTIFAAACAVIPAFGAAVPVEEGALAERSWHADSLKSLVTAVKKVSAATKIVDADALNITSSDFDPLFQLYLDSITLNDTITNQTLVVNKAKPLCDQEAKILAKTVSDLVKDVQKLAKDIIAIKDYTVEAGVNQIVELVFLDEIATADRFSNALISKTPTEKKLGLAYKKKVDDALNKAIQVYST